MTCCAVLRPCTSIGAPLVGFDGEVEADRFLAQRHQRMVERGRRTRRQPAAEGEERAAIFGRAGIQRQRADQLRLPVVAAPHDDPLVAQVEHRVGALQRRR